MKAFRAFLFPFAALIPSINAQVFCGHITSDDSLIHQGAEGLKRAGVRLGSDFSTTNSSKSSDSVFGSASTVNAGGNMELTSGRDFRSVGGQFSSDKDLTLDVEGDAIFDHFIDTLVQSEESATTGVSASVTYGVGGSGSANASHSFSNYDLDQGSATNTTFSSRGKFTQNIAGTTTRTDGTDWFDEESSELAIPPIDFAMVANVVGNLAQGNVGTVLPTENDLSFNEVVTLAGHNAFGSIFEKANHLLLNGSDQELANLDEMTDEFLLSGAAALGSTIVGHWDPLEEMWANDAFANQFLRPLVHGAIAEAFGHEFMSGFVGGTAGALVSSLLHGVDGITFDAGQLAEVAASVAAFSATGEGDIGGFFGGLSGNTTTTEI